MPLKLNSSGGGSVTLQEPTTASNLTLNLPATSGNVVAADASGNITVSGALRSNTANPPTIQNSSGTEIGTLCRAWVNFNGLAGASPVIRSSFNVSSVVRSATGLYQVNFATAMPDANYATTATNQYRSAGAYESTVIALTPTASSVSLGVADINSGAGVDAPLVCAAVFR